MTPTLFTVRYRDMIPPLPSELIGEILRHCTNGSLARSALANKVLLDFSRSHLYRHIHWAHPWAPGGCTTVNSVAAHPYLVSHTRHLRIDFFNVESTASGGFDALSQLVNDVQGFGKLEYLTLSALWSTSLRFKALFLSLVRMSSLISISLSLDENMDSACCIPFISSPKLREMSVFLNPWYKDTGRAPTSDFVILNPALKFIFHSPDRLDLSNIRRLDIRFVWAEVVTVYIVNLLTACNNLTHLRLGFEGLSFDDEEIPTLFIPIQRLRSLTSLTIETDINMTTIDKMLDQFHLIIQKLPPKAPMRCIILDIYWTSPSLPNTVIENHPTLETLRSILKSRHDPRCQLVIHVGRV